MKLTKLLTIRVTDETYDAYQSNPVIAAHARSVFRSVVDGEIVIEPDGETFTGVEDANPHAEYIANLEDYNQQLLEAIEKAIPYQTNLQELNEKQSKLIDNQNVRIEQLEHAIEHMRKVAEEFRKFANEEQLKLIDSLRRMI